MAEPSSSTNPCLEIAHVLFMDIVAYSTLPMDLQQRLLQELQEAVRSTPTFARAQAEEQLIRLPTGDGMALVFFHDPEAPVHCALELARVLRNNPGIKLRMGIHTGPVYRVADINANRNVAGGGINIAQRVMDCGDAGHILVSSAVAEVLGQVSAWSPMLHDVGEAEVKHKVRVHLFNLFTADVGNAELPHKLKLAREVGVGAASITPAKATRWKIIASVGAVLIFALCIGGWLIYAHKAHALTDKDTIVLADFDNKTGDVVFDDTLRQGLSVQLEQSPFLSMLSDSKINQTLKLMGRPAGDRLTQEVTREVCQRTGSKAMLTGSIAELGSQFVLGLKAVNCQSGDPLAQEQVQAARKEDVLNALGEAIIRLRPKLGESLSTVQKFDVPLEQATTSSLEALKAYSLGQKIFHNEEGSSAIPYYRRAIELDPNFAMAYSALGILYGPYLLEHGLATENFRKAYELRDRVSERERLNITANYFYGVTGELEKYVQTLKTWAEAYPRDAGPYPGLGYISGVQGRYEDEVKQSLEGIRLDPSVAGAYENLMSGYIPLGHLVEAKTVGHQALDRRLEGQFLYDNLYAIAFLEGIPRK